jgi:acetyl esterase/lipase
MWTFHNQGGKVTHKNRREFVGDALGAGIALGIAPAVMRADKPLQPPAAKTNAGGPYALVDPELIPVLKALPKIAVTNETFLALRQTPAPPPLPAPAPQPVERSIPGPPGAPEVRLIIVDPAPGGKGRPAFLHTHGGGYVGGTVADGVNFVQKIAQTCSCVVVSVDYRLAPETRFPGALEDNYSALRWLYSNANALGVDRKRIAVGGESAGGGHAAALAVAARDRKEIPLAFQLLIYPMLDDRTGSSRPVPPHIGSFIWTAESNTFGWTSLLGVPAGSVKVPAGAVPARVENLAGLPPAFIVVGSIDLFVDEDVDYARRLIASGVPTELHVVPGAYHGFDVLVPQAAVTGRFTEYWTAALRRALANT